jgi:hypothetical protein
MVHRDGLPNTHLHERQIAKLLLVSGYGPLALLHHVFDRLENAGVCLADFLDLQVFHCPSVRINEQAPHGSRERTVKSSKERASWILESVA